MIDIITWLLHCRILLVYTCMLPTTYATLWYIGGVENPRRNYNCNLAQNYHGHVTLDLPKKKKKKKKKKFAHI